MSMGSCSNSNREIRRLSCGFCDQLRTTGVDPEQHEVSANFLVAAHEIFSKSFANEIKSVFPTVQSSRNFIVVCTLQRSQYDLAGLGDLIEQEKDRLLESFFYYAEMFCKLIEEMGFWGDYIDPCSGLPMKTHDCNMVYNEVQSAEILLNFGVINIGCCKVLLHPQWGSAVYPASIFTTAPAEIVIDALSKLHDHNFPAVDQKTSAVPNDYQCRMHLPNNLMSWLGSTTAVIA